MFLMNNIPLMFRLDFSNMAVDDTVAFCISILLAVIVNAEGQAFLATLLGDARKDSKDRFHFNAFLHLDILGTVCFFIAGFGWAKFVDIRTDKFSHPALFMIFSRFAGICANFLMAGIAASIIGIMSSFGSQDRVFSVVMTVNLSTAFYHLIPIPPLAGASLITAWFTNRTQKIDKIIRLCGSLAIIGIFLSERMGISKLIWHRTDPIIERLFHLVLG